MSSPQLIKELRPNSQTQLDQSRPTAGSALVLSGLAIDAGRTDGPKDFKTEDKDPKSIHEPARTKADPAVAGSTSVLLGLGIDFWLRWRPKKKRSISRSQQDQSRPSSGWIGFGTAGSEN